MNTVDLTQRPPRSTRVKLGGYVLLPRSLDKGRAHIAGKAGEYHFNCPLDQRLFAFIGVNADDVLSLLKEENRTLKFWLGYETTPSGPILRSFIGQSTNC